MSSEKAQGSRNRGCDSCRKRHLRCDDAHPCAQCSISGRHCVRSSTTRFQHTSIPNHSKRAQFTFGADQPWFNTPEPLSFIEETSTLRLEYGHPNATTNQSGIFIDSFSPGNNAPLFDDEDGDRDISPDEVPAGIVQESFAFQSITRAESKVDRLTEAHSSDDCERPGILGSTDSSLPMLPDYMTSRHNVGFPLANKQNAQSLRKFNNEIAPTFDLGAEAGLNESLLSLGTVHSPVIEAILAACVDEIPLERPYTAAPRSSLEVPSFLSTDSVALEALLASALWRFKTRVSSRQPSRTEQPMLLQQEPLGPSMWFVLQQEIFLSAINQEPLSFDAVNILTQKHNSQLQWPNRLQLHLADVVNFCFGSGDDTHSTFDDLVNFSLSWLQLDRYLHSSSSFGQVEDTPVFPAIYAVGEGLLSEMQIYHVVKILLSAHDPALPRLGRRRKECMRVLDIQAKDDLMVICGLAESLGGVTRAHVMACVAISLIGDRLLDGREQAAVMEILEKTMSTALWNTTLIQQHLKEEWGWT